MEMYTLDDILNDIEKFEGVRISVNPILTQSRFFKLYSEYYVDPLKSAALVDDVIGRVRGFVADVRYHLPHPDVVPTGQDTNPFWAYGNNIDERKSYFLGSFKTHEEMEAAITDEVFSKYEWVLIVNHELGAIVPLLGDEDAANHGLIQ